MQNAARLSIGVTHSTAAQELKATEMQYLFEGVKLQFCKLRV